MTNQPKSGIGVKFNKDTPNIPFLMFADDCIIFLQDNKNAANIIKQTLDHYCMVSEQLVNYKKSYIEFSNGVSNIGRKIILQIPISNKMGIVDAGI